MNETAISAIAALTGAAIGGLTSIVATWLTQRTQARVRWLERDALARQEVYREFIEEASKCYVDALQHDNADIPALVSLYAKVNRMRVQSSPKVVEIAEEIARKIVDTYLEPDKNFQELREMVNSRSIDLIRHFSEACRAELDQLRAQQF